MFFIFKIVNILIVMRINFFHTFYKIFKIGTFVPYIAQNQNSYIRGTFNFNPEIHF